MSDLFEKNLRALESSDPELAEKLKISGPAGYRLVLTVSGGCDLEIAADGAKIYDVDDPSGFFNDYWRNRTLKNSVNTILLGLDLGYNFVELIKNPPIEAHNYYLVERDLGLFRQLLHVQDFSKLFCLPNVQFFVDVDEADLYLKLFELLERDVFPTVTATGVDQFSFSYRKTPDYYRGFLKAYVDAAGSLLERSGNSCQDSYLGVLHMLLNVPVIGRYPGLNSLEGSLKGVPAIVVAAGPSLDNNYELLREVGDRALVLCVDVILKFLLNKDVRPHIATVLERVAMSASFFRDIDPEKSKNTYQVSVPVVTPETIEVYSGPKALMYRPFAHFKWLENEKGTLLTGASCANMAFKIAEYLGCSPIILVGQDLAYGDEGVTHTRATPWGKSLSHISPERSGTMWVKGNISDEVLTNSTWEMFRMTYVKDIAEYGGEVINATEGGAYIEGTTVMDLRRAIAEYLRETHPLTELLAEKLAPSMKTGGWLDRLREERVPATVKSIQQFIDLMTKKLAMVERASAKDAPQGDRLLAIRESLMVMDSMRKTPLFYEAAYHVLQPLAIQTLLEHHDTPNRLTNRSRCVRRQLELQREFLTDSIAMLEKTKRLYLDPREARAAELFASNLNQLKRYPELRERMKKLGPTTEFARVAADDGGWSLEPPPPASETSLDAGDERGNPAVRIILGPELGCDAMAQAERETISRHYVLVEKEIDIFRHLLHAADLSVMTRVAKKRDFFVGEQVEATLFRQPNLTPYDLAPGYNPVIQRDRGYCRDPEYYETMAHKIVEMICDRREALFKEVLSTRTLLNGLRNLSSIPVDKDLAALKGAAEERVGFIVRRTVTVEEAATLSSAKGNSVILCTGEALAKLVSVGVTPDIVTAGTETSSLPPDVTGRGSLLLCDVGCDPQIVEAWRGPKLLHPQPGCLLSGFIDPAYEKREPAGELASLVRVSRILGCAKAYIVGESEIGLKDCEPAQRHWEREGFAEAGRHRDISVEQISTRELAATVERKAGGESFVLPKLPAVKSSMESAVLSSRDNAVSLTLEALERGAKELEDLVAGYRNAQGDRVDELTSEIFSYLRRVYGYKCRESYPQAAFLLDHLVSFVTAFTDLGAQERTQTKAERDAMDYPARLDRMALALEEGARAVRTVAPEGNE